METSTFSQPRPRPPRSPSRAAKIQVQNRRREYLDQNPSYFSSPEHELADPDLYDKLVRHFQTTAEREAEGRAKGWGKTLESSLMRGEDRLERVAAAHSGDRPSVPVPSTLSCSSLPTQKLGSANPAPAPAAPNFDIDAALADDKPMTKEQGHAAWHKFLRERFVTGSDEDFDYCQVDQNEDLDATADRDREEAYFDEQEPEWADDSEEDEPDKHAGGAGQSQKPKRERVLLGQTGIQDY
ncbi:coiled-coil domain-containing protein-domain-containing protein [Coniella lustricola]|uniref:Coiled-coil domain-containing protein-domain-containing protein n=1 Tax=Coniella lustricola TaxID=2025994 RepID=A0A2T2ZWH9_9PEZI|nr:coiled-coil domain-containing protein-domain-containing protein [Coniella lustricola]